MNREYRRGFTLVEMLVAVSILGLLGVISWRGLEHVMDQREWIRAQTGDVERVVRTLAQVERDVDQHISDALVTDSLSGVLMMPKSVSVSKDTEGNAQITLLRRHATGKGAQLVVYRLRDRHFERIANAMVNSTRQGAVDLLDGVVGLKARLLADEGWAERAEDMRTRARALEITIERDNGDRYVKVMPL